MAFMSIIRHGRPPDKVPIFLQDARGGSSVPLKKKTQEMMQRRIKSITSTN